MDGSKGMVRFLEDPQQFRSAATVARLDAHIAAATALGERVAATCAEVRISAPCIPVNMSRNCVCLPTPFPLTVVEGQHVELPTLPVAESERRYPFLAASASNQNSVSQLFRFGSLEIFRVQRCFASD